MACLTIGLQELPMQQRRTHSRLYDCIINELHCLDSIGKDNHTWRVALPLGLFLLAGQGLTLSTIALETLVYLVQEP